jgi:hypothetical protein
MRSEEYEAGTFPTVEAALALIPFLAVAISHMPNTSGLGS